LKTELIDPDPLVVGKRAPGGNVDDTMLRVIVFDPSASVPEIVNLATEPGLTVKLLT